MLPASHNRAYQDFLTLLTEFEKSLTDPKKKVDNLQIQQGFQHLEQWFTQNIASLDQEELEQVIASRWQSVQTEIKREFKLLTTDILFLASARQNATRIKRIGNISDRLNKLLGYVRIMVN